ncbi:MAG: hypothetical protein ACUVUD_03555 [bacterium]
MSLGLKLLSGCFLLVMTGVEFGAEIYARKMEIVKTPTGQATVFRDSVAITQDNTLLVSRKAMIQEQEGWAVFSESVLIQTPEARVAADSVVYDFQERKVTMLAPVRNYVVVRQDSTIIRAFVVIYLIPERLLEAPRGLEMTTENGDFILRGAHGSYDLTKRTGVVDSAPVLTIKRGDDLVQITARRMEYQGSGAFARAEGEVCVQSGVSLLLCDTAVFYPNRDSGFAWGGVVVKDSAGRAEGDTVAFLISQGALRRVVLLGQTKGMYRTEEGDTVLVHGSVISVVMTEGKIEQIEVAKLSAGQLIRKVAEK